MLSSWASGWSLRRWTQASMVCLLAVVMLGAGDSDGRFNRLGHQLMCACGCGQILLECNHVGCPDSDRMIHELREQVAARAEDSPVMNWFAGKYGATVLAAPIRGGFDNVAWIAPIAAFLLATVGVAVLLRVWRLRSVKTGPVGVPTASGDATLDALRERIRKETEY